MSPAQQIGVMSIAAVLECFASTSVWAQLTQAPRTPAMEQKQQQRPSSSIVPVALPTVVEAQSLTISPVNPKPGDQVTAKFTIKNSGIGTVANVPWFINVYGPQSPVEARGEHASLRPGGSFNVTATWTATVGLTSVEAYVGRALNSSAAVQSKQMDVSVAGAAASQNAAAAGAPRLVRQVLNYQKAKAAGARFSHGVDGVGGCAEIGQYDRGGTSASVQFIATGCINFGGRATPEAFTDFQLKNGWKIAGGAGAITVTVGDRSERLAAADWQWAQRPNEGGVDTAMKMRIWSEAPGGIAVWVTVMIEGPEGTDPYVASAR